MAKMICSECGKVSVDVSEYCKSAVCSDCVQKKAGFDPDTMKREKTAEKLIETKRNQPEKVIDLNKDSIVYHSKENV